MGEAGIRCFVAEGPAISQPRATGEGLVDCVVVGGGISGFCIALALATKHRDKAPDVVVTEARDRVGGNITTVERNGYLWEEGPNSFQPFDPILTMVNQNSQLKSSGEQSSNNELAYANQGADIVSLMRSGTLDVLLSQGKEYILVVNSDNVGTIIDPKILNHLIQNKVECCMEARPTASIDVNGDFVNFKERKFQLINGPEDI